LIIAKNDRVFHKIKSCGMPLFLCKKQKEGDFMCDSRVLHLKFVGMDSWDFGLWLRFVRNIINNILPLAEKLKNAHKERDRRVI